MLWFEHLLTAMGSTYIVGCQYDGERCIRIGKTAAQCDRINENLPASLYWCDNLGICLD